MKPEDLLPESREFFGFTLPETITASGHWHGQDADRVYVLRAPTLPELRAYIKNKADFHDTAKAHVSGIGSQAGESPTADEVSDWWDRIGPKATSCVVNTFIDLFSPSEDEMAGLRSSKRRL